MPYPSVAKVPSWATEAMLEIGAGCSPAATIRVVIASPDPVFRMQLRRLLAEAGDIGIAGSCPFSERFRDAVTHAAATIALVDARTDEAGALGAVRLVSALGIRTVVLRGPQAFHAAGLSLAATLLCPALPSQETAKGAFAQELVAALRKASPRSVLPIKPAALRGTALPEVIAFGSSTGGPQALMEVFRTLGDGIVQPMVLTQHMPPRFTGMLAQQINRKGLTAVEAANGMPLEPGRLYIAPGGRHLVLTRQADRLTCLLDDGPAENFCRPAVDVMLRSVVRTCGGNALAVILTGMGSDGLAGCRELVQAGGAVLAQDEATSIVWGMPGAVAQAGLCRAVLPLAEMSRAITALATGHKL